MVTCPGEIVSKKIPDIYPCRWRWITESNSSEDEQDGADQRNYEQDEYIRRKGELTDCSEKLREMDKEDGELDTTSDEVNAYVQYCTKIFNKFAFYMVFLNSDCF